MTNPFPSMLLVEQSFPETIPLQIEEVLERELARVRDQIKPGARLAVGVGSRGITNLERIVRQVLEVLRSAGARPFIIPAMGSHGGATPEGQMGLLAEYGITEARLGVPIRGSLEVERIGTTPDGLEAYCSVEALRADGVVLINRIKPHTDFRGRIGSGLMKMSVIGLGKRVGATHYHIGASRLGYEEALRQLARITLGHGVVRFGVAILENQRHETAHLEALRPEEMERREGELFRRAEELMPKLPLEDIDLLIIDRIGKNVSGSGMDPNIIGRSVHGYSSFLGQKDLPAPRIKRIFVRDLTSETHGNGIGIGFADLTTTRLVEQLDKNVTYVNALTSLTPQGAKIPIHFDTDRQAIELGLQSLGLADPSKAVVVRIADTLSLETLEVSEAAWEILGRQRFVGLRRPLGAMRFASDGNLLPLGADQL